jgi:hypothetical protein
MMLADQKSSIRLVLKGTCAAKLTKTSAKRAAGVNIRNSDAVSGQKTGFVAVPVLSVGVTLSQVKF